MENHQAISNFHDGPTDIIGQAVQNKEILIELGNQNSKFPQDSFKSHNIHSQQMAQNQKRIKEIERTFNISLTNNPFNNDKPARQPAQGVHKDPFENDQRPIECLSQRLSQLQAKAPQDPRRQNDPTQRSVAVKAGQLQVFMNKVDRAESTNQHIDYNFKQLVEPSTEFQKPPKYAGGKSFERRDRQGVMSLQTSSYNHVNNKQNHEQQLKSNYFSQERDAPTGLVLGIQGQAAGIGALNTQKNSVIQAPSLGVKSMGMAQKTFKTYNEGRSTHHNPTVGQKRDKSQDKLSAINIGHQILMNSKSSKRLAGLQETQSAQLPSTHTQTATGKENTGTHDPYSASSVPGTQSSATIGNPSLCGTGRAIKDNNLDHFNKQYKYKNRMMGSQPSVGSGQTYHMNNTKPEMLLPPVHSNRVSRGGMATGIDIASKRRQIAVMRSRHFERNDPKASAYNSVNSNHRADPPTAQICRNGFENQQIPQAPEPISVAGISAQGLGINTSLEKVRNDDKLDKEETTVRTKTEGSYAALVDSPSHNNFSSQKKYTYAYAIKSQIESLNISKPKGKDFSGVDDLPKDSPTYALQDYIFVLISNESFKRFYKDNKVFVQYPAPEGLGADSSTKQMRGPQPMGINHITPQVHSKKALTKSPFTRFNQDTSPNLNSLMNVKQIDKQYSKEVPEVSCHLLSTQIDFLKVLECQEVDRCAKSYVLTSEAQEKMEIEKQTRVKQYMDDIISKLTSRDRKHMVTVKKKYIDEALDGSVVPEKRTSQVYVIVINRDKDYDPIISQKLSMQKKNQFKRNLKPQLNKLMKDKQTKGQSADSSDDDLPHKHSEKKMTKKTIHLNDELNDHHLVATKYASDTEYNNFKQNQMKPHSNGERISSAATAASGSVIKKGALLQHRDESNQPKSRPYIQKPFRITEPVKFKWTRPEKTYEKYGPTKIKIYQDFNTYSHLKTHKINVFFDQYNEFIRHVFKYQKSSYDKKMNVAYVVGLGKALGLKVTKDTFTDQNLKSREAMQQLKEKLVTKFFRKIQMDNQDIFPTPQQDKPGSKKNNNLLSLEKHNSVSSEIKSDTRKRSQSNERKMEQSVENTPQPKGPTKLMQEDTEHKIVKQEVQPLYKYQVGKGNNALLVRSLFKNRFWWMIADKGADMERLNFMWTQIKNANYMDRLLCKYPEKQSGLGMKFVKDKVKGKVDPYPEDSIYAKQLENKIYNKCEDNFHVANKKALFLNMQNFYQSLGQDPFLNIPITFHIKNGTSDPDFMKFTECYMQIDAKVKERKALRIKLKQERADRLLAAEDDSPQKGKDTEQEPKLPPTVKNIWIIKPGENTNCGNGIQVAKDFNEITQIVTDSNLRNNKRTCIVQQYIANPLLYNRRKFDVRTFAMITSVGGNLKVYVFNEGYIRTCSYEFEVNNFDRLIHLTNDAIQKKDKNYGKYEVGNKLSYVEFQAYIDKTYPDLNMCWERDINPQIYKMTTDIFRATYDKLDPKRRVNTFEVFGLDFMLDDEFKLYLIEVNTNPCLELSSPLLARLIPQVLENALKIAVDPLFMPPEGFSSKKAFVGDLCPETNFQLIYDEKIDGPVLDSQFRDKNSMILELDEEDLSDEQEQSDEEKDQDFNNIAAILGKEFKL